jgi:hypothetical protein
MQINIGRPSNYIKDMAELPLVEGKSLCAEMVCPAILREYKHVLQKYGRWPVRRSDKIDGDGKEALTQEDVSLNIIRRFAENCSKRSKYERALLDERSALSNANDVNPGVELIHRLTRKKFLKDNKKEELIKLGAVVVPSGGVHDEVRVNWCSRNLGSSLVRSAKACCYGLYASLIHRGTLLRHS